MTTSPTKDRSHESIINDTLARLLRERSGLSTAAETLHDGKRPDIIVRLPEGPVILETEFEPARTVEADALSRLGMSIDGQRVQNVFAVTVPARLRSTNQRHLYQRLATATLVWQEWRIDGTSGPRLTGSAVELGNAVARSTPPAGNLDEAVDALDEGVRWAGSRLYSSPGTVARVSRIFGAEPGDEVANMAALVIINAMVFQERLASGEAAYQSTSAARVNGMFSRIKLLQMWDHILGIDYYPIFSMARDVVQELSEVEAAEVLAECAKTAATLLGMGAVGRHDLAGRIFNRLISERKLLAAFYTSIPASTPACRPGAVARPVAASRVGLHRRNLRAARSRSGLRHRHPAHGRLPADCPESLGRRPGRLRQPAPPPGPRRAGHQRRRRRPSRHPPDRRDPCGDVPAWLGSSRCSCTRSGWARTPQTRFALARWTGWKRPKFNRSSPRPKSR